MFVGAGEMFVNGIPFLITHSWGIILMTIEFPVKITVKQLAWCLQRALNLYSWAGYAIQTPHWHGIQEVKGKISALIIDVITANEYVAEFDDIFQTIKIPWHHQHCTIFMYTQTHHNNILTGSSVLDQKSPRELICHHGLVSNLHCRISFKASVKGHNKP